MFNEEVMNIDIYTKRNSNSQEKPTNFLSLRGIGWEDKNFVRDSFKDSLNFRLKCLNVLRYAIMINR